MDLAQIFFVRTKVKQLNITLHACEVCNISNYTYLYVYTVFIINSTYSTACKSMLWLLNYLINVCFAAKTTPAFSVLYICYPSVSKIIRNLLLFLSKNWSLLPIMSWEKPSVHLFLYVVLYVFVSIWFFKEAETKKVQGALQEKGKFRKHVSHERTYTKTNRQVQNVRYLPSLVRSSLSLWYSSRIMSSSSSFLTASLSSRANSFSILSLSFSCYINWISATRT
jgi:hypothetical protein